MEPLARNGYTADQVRAALHGAARHMSYRYELLDDANRHKAWLPNVLEARVSYNALAEIKRTARFVLREDPAAGIDWLRDRIRPWARLRMPDGATPSSPWACSCCRRRCAGRPTQRRGARGGGV